MESNGNQRKRGGRNAKNANAYEKSSQNLDNNDVREVSVVAISPTLEESETVNNAPASECRRSSRKKIIKFDVRDLLNKNRKTHKIQIEARIDSNAPTTSKAAICGGAESSSSKKSSSTSREDLLSQHKTFLEKSAIFRRYSVSQEHKAPPPPLPIPPLLGKGNDHKESNFSGTSNCQEFLSHVMIKPKEPTSLIVAQIESNKPSLAATTKRKNMYKSIASANKIFTSYETAIVVQPKKRGRPSKIKTQAALENLMLSSEKDEKKITPEKARNWKEYKACVAQQSGSSREDNKITKKVDKAIIISKQRKDVAHILFKKQDDEVKNFEDTLQSDISRSDDDGNFSGFQNSKDDVSCDSPILENKVFGENADNKDTVNSPILIENTSKENTTTFKCEETKSSRISNQIKPSFEILINEDNEIRDKKESDSTKNVEAPSEQNPIQPDLNLKPKKNEAYNFEKEECKITKETTLPKKNLNSAKTEKNFGFEFKKINQNMLNSTQQLADKARNEFGTSKSETNSTEDKPFQYKQPLMADECQANQKLNRVSKETEIICSTPFMQEIQDTPSNSENIEINNVEQIQDKAQKVLLESEKMSKTSEPARNNTCGEFCLNSQILNVLHEVPKKLKTNDICAKTSQIIPECTPQREVVKTEILVLKNRTVLSQQDETKSFSRTSSSSESENASERSSNSSEPFSSASSSSPRSYKSGDKLKVSVKRMILPKSPSTSSQTSTSEEFNKADVIRRKPPIAKRSKRIQKKFREALDGEEEMSENIDNCFQKISNDNKKPEPKPMNIQDIISYVINNNTEVEGNELTEIVDTESTITNTAQGSTESCIDAETTDTLSNESSNVKAKNIKRKSIRNRKDNMSCDKDVPTDKTKFEEKEKPPELLGAEKSTFIIEHVQQQKILSDETEKDNNEEQAFDKHKKKTATDTGSNHSDNFENNDNIKKLGELQTTRDLEEKQVITQSEDKEILISNEQAKIETADITTVNVEKLSKIENKEFQISTVVLNTDSYKNMLDKVTCEKPFQTTKIIQSRTELVSQHREDQKVEDKNQDKNFMAGKSTDPEVATAITWTTVAAKEEKFSKTEENINRYEPKMSNMNRNQQMFPKIGIDKQNKSDVLQVETREGTTISPKKKVIRSDKEKADKVASPNFKTNEEETLAKKNTLQNWKNFSDKVKPTKFNEHASQSRRKKSGKEDQPSSEITHVAISKITQDKTSYEKALTIDKEAVNIYHGKNRKNTTFRKKIVKEIAAAENTEILKENDGNLKEISTDPKNEATILKSMDIKELCSTQDEAKTFSEKLKMIPENVGSDKSEKVIATRSSSNKIEISTKEANNEDTCRTHDGIQLEVSTKQQLQNVESSSTTVLKKNLKEDFTFGKEISQNYFDRGDQSAVILLKSNLEYKETGKLQQQQQESEQQSNVYSDKSVLLHGHKKDVISVNPLTGTKNNIEGTSPNTRKKSVFKKSFNSSTLSTSSSENSQTCTAELFSPSSPIKDVEEKLEENSERFQDSKLHIDTLKIAQTPATLSLTNSSTDLNKPCQNADLVEKLEKTDEVIEKVELTNEICNSNTQQKTALQDSNDLSVIVPIVTKRRIRKSRFKNLHGPELDSETENSNGKSTPIDEINHQKKNTETKMLTKAQIEGSEIENVHIFSETDGNVRNEIEKKSKDVNVVDESVSLQENSQGNLLSSQIKNVSIETNTLLDILRTVQSNTEAALKAHKSPINIDAMNKDSGIESCCKIQFEEFTNNSLDSKPQKQEHKTTSPLVFDTESSLTVKKQNLSPARSESSSPSILKKVTPPPTRSTSSSPLTLKKVTRRYDRRSRRAEDCAHKTLEETFAEIAAQSSKAVLAAKEFDINEEQTRNEKSQKELEVNISSNFEKKDLTENFGEIEKKKTSILAEMHLNNEKQVESVLNVTEDFNVSQDFKPVEILVEVETAKVTPNRKNCKQKILPLEQSMIATQELLEINNSTVNKENSAVVTEIVKENKIQSETEAAGEGKLDENKSMTQNVNGSPETVPIKYLSGSENSSPLMSEPYDDCKHSSILSKTTVEESLKELDMSECKSSKKVKKYDCKELSDDDATDTSPDKEEEGRTPKLPMKKRDSSISKSETKSVCKKNQKKTKTEEEDALNLQKEETLMKIEATTPPPSKKGRKPKNQQPETLQTSSKKKNKKDVCIKNDEDINPENIKALDSESDSVYTSTEKSLDEKMAKKKRQKKLKEAFEAALTDDKEKCKEISQSAICDTTSAPNFGLTLFFSSPPPEKSHSISNEEINETIKFTCVTPANTEEDLDPLKDIEKFIADGVNLLKKDYKLDEDSVDDVMHTTPTNTTKTVDESIKNTNEETKHIFITFETPADTPINTPSATPPPKSPTSIESTPDENCGGVRRSHRIKLITKTPKALVGRGLVRDRERFSIKDDVETKSHYTMDDHLTDLAEVEAKNAKFLKEMEERLSNFQVIKENDYLCERVISREAKKMICDCFLTHEEEGRGELGCGEDCLNRLLMIECGPECNVKERCTNKRFQKLLCSPCRVFRTEKKGFGIMADIEILPGEFIMEYVGEVIDTEEFEKRRLIYSQDKNRHYYFMALRSDAIIDATIKGNISRFINHSCDPNAETQKWTVNGELRIGFFSRKSIMPGEEITFNYQYQRYGREAQRCYCESVNCTGWIGQEPTSDEGEQMDDEYDESEDEEEADASNLLVHDDDDDSDASVADPEEVQKQLEMAAAQAEVELAPLQLLQGKVKQAEATLREEKSLQDLNKSDNEEDSKSKFKKLLSKMAEKVAAKQKQNKREQKLRRKKKSKESSAELANKLRFLEDPDIEDEVEFLKECGLKNQSDTLRLSRLMVRAKLVQTRLNLLEILRKGDLPCRRLFLDYHGLRLLHGWMSEDAGNMQIRMSLLQTLETLPIANKTVLTDSKVMQAVRTWSGSSANLSPNEDSSSSNSNSQDAPVQSAPTFEEGSEMAELQKLALKLITTWEGLPEIFRIPKKERIEQMKEHEREADRQYAANAETQEINTATDRFRRDRFGRGLNTANTTSSTSNRFFKPNNGNPHKTANTKPENLKNLSKAERREMFAAKVARAEAEKRLAEERREFETKCRFFGLDPKKTRAQDIPFCVNPGTGQWFSIERKPIATPPSYAHVQVPVKHKSTDPKDYELPAVCSSLPSQWKYAITPQGKIYYYHIKHRISQWEPPTPAQLQQCELETWEDDSESEIFTTAGEDSSDDDDDILIGMDTAQLKAYIDRKVEMRRQKRYQRLVDQRSISPRREEDRIYNQIEVRKYKENKEKIRKRKEDIRRRRAEALRQTSLNMCTLGSITDTNPCINKSNNETNEELGALPIQDYLLSSDEEIDLKAEVNSPLIDKIVEGDKIVDELDALTTKRQLKRPLPPHRDFNKPSTSTSITISSIIAAKQEYKKRKLEKKEKRKPKEQDAKYRKNKEKFRCEIAGIIVHHLKPYLKETCTSGRIQSNEDFNHLARKLTHFVMIKELKYCESVGQTLVVTDSVKSKSREFIKKYMAKYGEVYIKPTNDPDFKDIPFTL